MNSTPDLKLDWCSFKAAEYACKHWHYAHSITVGKSVKIGVWEAGKFIGAIVFSRGANKSLGKPYGCTQTQCCELVRVALRSHRAPVTRIVAIALRFLKKHDPSMRLVISFADPEQGHAGAIYQAGNWIYSGRSESALEYIVHGKRMHGRTMRSLYGTHVGKDFITTISGSSKHRYLMPLDDDMRAQLQPFAKPFPSTRVKQATVSYHETSGGAAPTHALQIAM